MLHSAWKKPGLNDSDLEPERSGREAAAQTVPGTPPTVASAIAL